MPPATLIWDLDGTLLDSYGIIASSLQETLKDFGLPMDLEAVRRLAKEGSVSAVIDLAQEKTGLPARQLKDRYSEISGSRALEIPLMLHGREILEETAALGAAHLVYTHRGKTAVPVLEHLGILDFFEEVVTSLNGFPRKPSPDALLYLIERHRLEKSRTLYVGDRTLDAACARNAGVRSVLYAPEGGGTGDYVVRDLLEIKSIAASL